MTHLWQTWVEGDPVIGAGHRQMPSSAEYTAITPPGETALSTQPAMFKSGGTNPYDEVVGEFRCLS